MIFMQIYSLYLSIRIKLSELKNIFNFMILIINYEIEHYTFA